MKATRKSAAALLISLGLALGTFVVAGPAGPAEAKAANCAEGAGCFYGGAMFAEGPKSLTQCLNNFQTYQFNDWASSVINAGIYEDLHAYVNYDGKGDGKAFQKGYAYPFLDGTLNNKLSSAYFDSYLGKKGHEDCSH
jgi:hypothetical protein